MLFSQLCPYVAFPLSVRELSVPLLIKTLILKDQGAILMTSFDLNYFLIGPTSKYSHTGDYRFPVAIGRVGDTIQFSS